MELETSAEHNTSSFEWHHIEATEKLVQLLSQHRQLHLLVLPRQAPCSQYRVPSNVTLEMLPELMKTDNIQFTKIKIYRNITGSKWAPCPQA